MTIDTLPQQKILLVDDDLVVRAKISEVLDQDGFQVILAKNGDDGISAYLEHRPDLILVDAVMPLVDGFEFCEKLKTLDSNRFTPILMITSLDDNESVDRAFLAGATDYITKPVNMAILRQRVKNLVQQYQLIKSQFNLNQELQQANQNLKALAHLDSLTKLTNRRGFEQYLHQQWEKMLKIKSPLALILGDVDYFKNYNDTYFHTAGDQCLIKVGMAMRNAVRRNGDLVARYGGEEFAVILPSTDTLGAVYVAENIRAGVKNLRIPHQGSQVSKYVSMSLGVATIIPSHDSSPQVLIDCADSALYQAKSQGRDRVVMVLA